MPQALRILIVEDVPQDAEVAVLEMRRAGIAVESLRVETEKDFVAALEVFEPDLILSDYRLPSFSGLRALELARTRRPDLPLIIYTGSLNEETAVGCMKAGAWDYVLKDRMSRLPSAITAALELAHRRSESARAAGALAESEERYRREHALLRALIDSIPDAIFFKDRESRYLGCNAAFAEHAGVPEAAIVGKTDLDIVAGDVAARFRETDLHVLRTGARWRGEVESAYSRSPGAVFDLIKTPYCGPGGEIVGLIGVSRDITERKAIERQLGQWADAFAHCAHGIALGAPQTNRILVCNPAFATMVGRRVEDVGGLPILDVYDPADHEHVRACIAEADRAGQVRYQARMRRADGGSVPVQMDIVSVRGAGGELLYRVATAQDITLRALAEESLKESEARYRSLVETSFDWIWEVDAEGRYSYASPRINDILGYSEQEVLGRTPFDLMPEEEARRVGEAFAAIVARREPFAYLENVNRHKSGRLVVLETSGVPVLGPGGELRGYRGTDRDVTERRRLLQQLNQAQKMEAVGRLAGGIAHDFNNLLQAMMSQAAVLRHAGEPGAPAAPLDEMEQLVRRGAALTRQLLLLSRQETPSPELLDLNDAIRGAATLLRRIVRENVAIVPELSSGELLVRADHGQIDQVLMNLVVNSSDAMPEGGRVTLASGCAGGCAWFAVADTGHGIPELERDRIFDPFYTTKPAGKGTGLGLSVVHGIVTAHGGRVEVGDADGGGTVFTVTLPLAADAVSAPAAAGLAAPGGPAAGRGERVLVVEDEDGAREALVTLLQILSYQASAVGSGEEARALAEGSVFDLLLTDLVLPGMTGLALATELRRRQPGLRVVVMSGYTEDEASRHAVGESPDGFLQKPFDVSALAGALRAVLDGGDGG